MTVRPYGEDALLVDVVDAAAARELATTLLTRLPGLVVDAVPSATSLLVRLAPGWDVRSGADRVAALGPAPRHDQDDPHHREDREDRPVGQDRTVEIPVTYDGPDLDDVAAATGLSPAEVVRRHSSPTYTAAFAGFAPGFVYLEGLDPVLQLPRRADPRTRVPPGAVAIAAGYTAVYPRESPGGWHLLGRTDAVLFDVAAEPPALIQPGDRVRFVPGERVGGERP